MDWCLLIRKVSGSIIPSTVTGSENSRIISTPSVAVVQVKVLATVKILVAVEDNSNYIHENMPVEIYRQKINIIYRWESM